MDRDLRIITSNNNCSMVGMKLNNNRVNLVGDKVQLHLLRLESEVFEKV